MTRPQGEGRLVAVAGTPETRRALRAMVQALAAGGRADVDALLDEYAAAGYHDPGDIAAVRRQLGAAR